MVNDGYQVDVIQETKASPALCAALERTIRQTLAAQHVHPPASVTLLIAGDDRLQALNQEFLGENRPTDILSFPAGDPPPGLPPEALERSLGDMALSLPAAQRQASLMGHELAAECQLLVVHGTLHLLGFDHAEADEKDRMWRVQSQILKELGVEVTLPE